MSRRALRCQDTRCGVRTSVAVVRTNVAVSRLALSSVVVSRQTLLCPEKRRGVNASVVKSCGVRTSVVV